MNRERDLIERIKIGLMSGLLMAMAGCAGYYGGETYDSGVVVSEPDMYLFGGGYDRRGDVHNYSRRGSESRVAAHSSGSRAVSHSGGNRGARR